MEPDKIETEKIYKSWLEEQYLGSNTNITPEMEDALRSYVCSITDIENPCGETELEAPSELEPPDETLYAVAAQMTWAEQMLKNKKWRKHWDSKELKLLKKIYETGKYYESEKQGLNNILKRYQGE